MIASLLVALLGLAGIVFFYTIFPDGRFAPRWMRWVALSVAAAGVLLGIATFSPAQAEWSWMASVLLLLSGVLAGVASQIYRYRRKTIPEERSQTRLVVLALVLLPLAFIAPAVLGDSPWAGFSGIFLSTLLLTALPLALVYSMLRRGLWGVRLQSSQKQRYALLVAVALIAWTGGISPGKPGRLRRQRRSHLPGTAARKRAAAPGGDR